jgi:hypothetical protein
MSEVDGIIKSIKEMGPEEIKNILKESEKKTKICPYCHEEILIGAVKCKHCQSNLKKEEWEAWGEKPKAKYHDSYWPLSLIAVLFPILGLLLGLIYLLKANHWIENWESIFFH